MVKHSLDRFLWPISRISSALKIISESTFLFSNNAWNISWYIRYICFSTWPSSYAKKSILIELILVNTGLVFRFTCNQLMAEMGVGGRINLIFIWKKLWKIKFAHIWYIFSSSAYSTTYIWNENILIEKKWDNFLGSEFWIFSFETLIPLLLGQSDVKNKGKEIPRINHQKMPSHWPGIDWFEVSGCHF